MKTTLKLEETAMAAIGIYFLSLHSLGLPFWAWAILFFSPDLGMLGYLFNTKVGAFCYNFLHHKGVAILLAGLGYYFFIPALSSVGIMLFAHASFDRIAGYGLKYANSFKNTHLGSLEKK